MAIGMSNRRGTKYPWFCNMVWDGISQNHYLSCKTEYGISHPAPKKWNLLHTNDDLTRSPRCLQTCCACCHPENPPAQISPMNKSSVATVRDMSSPTTTDRKWKAKIHNCPLSCWRETFAKWRVLDLSHHTIKNPCRNLQKCLLWCIRAFAKSHVGQSNLR